MENKQKITGIVVEYNPLHNGHIYHIEQARSITQCDVLIAVMSPNFVQRGEPAFINKWTRTQYALEWGVDLVLELPTPYTIQSAETFATQAVNILAMAHIDTLVYGSETGIVTNELEIDIDHKKLEAGLSYAKAMNPHQQGPNDILGKYYTRACKNLNITPIAIKRTNAYHSLELDESIASATAIRYQFNLGKDTSGYTPINLTNIQTHRLNDYETLIKYALLSSNSDDLENISIVSEGIQNLLISNAHLNLAALIEACISKRYTRARIQRTLINILLNQSENIPKIQQFRVLGMSEAGQQHLRYLKKQEVSYTTHFKDYQFKDIEYRATSVYLLPYSDTYQKEQLDMEKSAIIRVSNK
ncbi:MAG: nucleotidyltransferase family protein [Erysipelothrix sp.]